MQWHSVLSSPDALFPSSGLAFLFFIHPLLHALTSHFTLLGSPSPPLFTFFPTVLATLPHSEPSRLFPLTFLCFLFPAFPSFALALVRRVLLVPLASFRLLSLLPPLRSAFIFACSAHPPFSYHTPPPLLVFQSSCRCSLLNSFVSTTLHPTLAPISAFPAQGLSLPVSPFSDGVVPLGTIRSSLLTRALTEAPPPLPLPGPGHVSNQAVPLATHPVC